MFHSRLQEPQNHLDNLKLKTKHHVPPNPSQNESTIKTNGDIQRMASASNVLKYMEDGDEKHLKGVKWAFVKKYVPGITTKIEAAITRANAK